MREFVYIARVCVPQFSLRTLYNTCLSHENEFGEQLSPLVELSRRGSSCYANLEHNSVAFCVSDWRRADIDRGVIYLCVKVSR